MTYRIAVVDDEALSLTNAKNMLESEDMRVSCLRSGPDLMKFVMKNTPDLILLDILMPDMDGFETFDRLREFEDNAGRPHIPVIFLTGENDSETEMKGLNLGASDYIRKPFDRDILIRRIENTINNNKTIETLTEEAKVDKLTGFLNKSRGTERISKLCARKNGALMILDLDNFKLVNDLFGHDMGDRVLSAAADVIRRNMRETDTVSRIGGDEFMAFYEDMTDESAVASLSMRLNVQVQEEASHLMGKDHGIPLGISMGVVIVPDHGRDYESLFGLADNALYTVKQNGKHGCRVYSEISEGDGADEEDPGQKLERLIRIVEERNDQGGALLLGNDSFALIYRFVMRFYKRYGGTAALVLFKVSVKENADKTEQLKADAHLSELLQKTLRMSDIIMQSGQGNYFVMLTERTRSEAKGAVKRIVDRWEEAGHAKEAVIEHAFRYIDYEKD